MTTPHFAYRIAVEQGPEVREYIGVGTSLLDATERAAARLEDLHGPEASLIAISRLGPALVRGTLPDVPRRAPATVTTKPSPPATKVTPMGAPAVKTAKTPRTAKTKKTAKPTGMTRVEQLVALLQERGGQAHLDQIATALGTGKQNAQNVIAAGAKQGLVRRLGQRTGEVALVQAEAPSPQPAEPQVASTVRSGPTRAEQVVAFLREQDGEAHITEIAEALGTSTLNARNCIAAAVKQGLVRRVGSRSGRVALVAAENEQEAQPSVRPEDLDGLQRQVYDALRAIGKPVTAKEIASRVGGRPREAGNAAALLVSARLARRVGDEQPARYVIA